MRGKGQRHLGIASIYVIWGSQRAVFTIVRKGHAFYFLRIYLCNRKYLTSSLRPCLPHLRRQIQTRFPRRINSITRNYHDLMESFAKYLSYNFVSLFCFYIFYPWEHLARHAFNSAGSGLSSTGAAAASLLVICYHCWALATCSNR